MAGHGSTGMRAAILAVVLTFAAGSVVVARGPSAAAAEATGDTPSTTSPSLPDINPKPDGYTAQLSAFVEPNTATGTVTFYDDGGARTEIGTATVGPHPFIQDATWATFDVPVDYPHGTYTVVAVYSGDGTFAPSESPSGTAFQVGPRPTATHVTVSGPHDNTGATAERGDTITVTVSVTDDSPDHHPNPFPMDGTMSLTVGGMVVPTPSLNLGVDVPTSGLSLGAHTIRAEFTSMGAVFTSSFIETTITIVENTVDATGVGLQYGTFYPVRDDYRDTVKVRGTRNEPASVSIEVRSSTGKVVKSASVAMGSGPYAVAWNGRTASGKILPTGRYRVVQVLTDADGASHRVTSEVALSGKRLVFDRKTIVQTFPKQVDYVGKAGAWVGWKFALPGATVYRKLVFAVDGRSGRPRGRLGPQDFRVCGSALVGPGCTSTSAALPGTRQWTSLVGDPNAHRSGTRARLFVWTTGGKVYLARARVMVTYGVLR